MDVSFTEVSAGNRRAMRRKMARMLGESGPRMRQRTKRLAGMPSTYTPPISSEYRVRARKDGSAYLEHRPTKRVVPERERPSPVVIVRA